MPFNMQDIFIAEPLPNQAAASNVWGNEPQIDLEKKKLFGIELAKGHPNVFEAAFVVFDGDTGLSLWVSQNLINDPEVLAARDLYAATVQDKLKILDKDQLAVKLLTIADEKVHGRYICEAKDRLKALELYAKLQGFTAETNISNNNFINNEMKVVFVKPSQQKEEVKQIDVTPTKPLEDNNSPITIKLVKSA